MYLLVGLVLCFVVNSIMARDTATTGNKSLEMEAKEYRKLCFKQKNTGDYLKAMEYLKLYELVRDSMEMARRSGQLKEIKARYETDQKKQAVLELVHANKLKELMIRRNRYIISGISGLALLLILVISLTIRQKRLKADQQALQLQQNLLRSQMNPHFIFNALTNIQSFIIRKETDLSLKYLGSFSTLVGNILDSSGKKLIPLQTELSVIENYLALQKLRYGDKLDFKVIVDPSVDLQSISVPPVLIQPLIENAIEHGIKHKEGRGNVTVRFKIIQNMLVVEVEDDGVGRAKAAEIRNSGPKNHAGLAIVILQERLAGKGRMAFQDLLDADGNGCGTISRLFLPI